MQARIDVEAVRKSLNTITAELESMQQDMTSYCDSVEATNQSLMGESKLVAQLSKDITADKQEFQKLANQLQTITDTLTVYERKVEEADDSSFI